MNFTSQICTTEEQSKRLLALGLKRETADCFLEYVGKDNYGNNVWHPSTIVNNFKMPDYSRDIPAWSLHRLIKMLSSSLMLPQYHQIVYTKKCVFFERDGNIYCSFNVYDSLYDNLIDCIKWLIQEEDFNKEYLIE